MTLGQKGEEIATQEYIKLGYTIMARNMRVHSKRQIGEFDIIALLGKEVVFVEVKTRKSQRYGTGAEAVDWVKQRKLKRSAQWFLYRNPQFDDYDWRIDVVEVDIDNLEKPAIIFVNAIEDD